MLTMTVKRFIKKTRRKMDLNDKETVGFDKTKVECYNCHRRGNFARESRASRNQGNINREAPRRNAPVDTSTTNTLVVQDGIGYQMGLESLEARIVVHEKNQAVYEENIAFLKYDVQVKDISIKELKNQLENALKEKDDLKLKLENFEETSKNLTKLINSQISAKDKTGLGYNAQINESELNNIHMNDSEVVHSVFNSRDSDVDDNPINDRFKTGKGFHAVPPPYTSNYMPPRPDLSFAGLDDSVFKSKVSETITILTKSEQVSIDATKQSSYRAAILVSAARHVNTAASRPNVNDALPTTYSYFKAHSLVKRPFNQKLAAKTNNFNKKINTARVNNVTIAGQKAVVRTANGNRDNAYALQDQGIFDSGCSKHMTGNKYYLSDYQYIDGGFVAFTGSPKGGKITRKGKIRTGKLDFEDVYFVKELKFNFFFVSQMCDKKNSVIFTETECLVLCPDFKLLDESQVLLKVPRQNNMYSFDLKNVIPLGEGKATQSLL
ncbi:hypothetical protein Tco_1416356 [Tanacetum coccineum]